MSSSTMVLAVASSILLILSTVQCYSECPSVCTCIWKNGKQTSECTGKGLTVIPSDLSASTQVIDVSRNSFTEIPSRSFQKKGLVNLQKIYVAECGLSRIAPDAFFQLRNLVELDLSGNKLRSIPAEALKDCPNLRRLQISHNPIHQIEGGAFSSLSHLISLGLANCHINHLQPGALDGLENLEQMELNGNKLTSLSISVFKPLRELHELNLHNNPWYCDCKIQKVRMWMMEHKIPLSIPPQCHGPPIVKDLSWKAMSLDDFACPPIMIHVPTEATVIFGHNASVICQVDATPRSSIHWEVGGRSLKNISIIPELRAKYNVETDDSPRQSSILTIYNAEEADSEIYVCVAENKAGISSTNFTLSVICPNLGSSWSSTSITLLLVGVIFVILLAAAAICFLVYHPISLSFGSKINRNNVLHHLSSKNQDTVEMNDIREDKEEKDLKTSDKQPRHETGSSGYGSDQLTPDLVSKIADMNNGPSLSTSTVSCNHLDSDNPILIDGYGSTIDHWSQGKNKPPRYDGSPIRSNIYSEIYLNPCYGRDEDPYNYALQSAGVHELPDCAGDRYIPQNDRVRTLRGGYNCATGESSRDELCTSPTHGHDEATKRYPLVVANASGHFTVPAKARFSPDEGYAEEGLEGTEV